MKKFLAFFSILLSLFAVFSFISVNANSAIRRIVTSSYGIINVDDNPINVTKEDLTFNLYKKSATVTAEYTLYNDSNDDITAELLFPIGDAYNGKGAFSYEPSVSINNSKLSTKMRLIGSSIDIIDSLSYLSDDYRASILDEYDIYYYEVNVDYNRRISVEVTGGYVIPDYISDYYDIEQICAGRYTYDTFSNYCFVLAKGEYSINIDYGNTEYNVRESSKQELVRKFVYNAGFESYYDYYDEVDIYNIFVLEFNLAHALAVIDYSIDIDANSSCINTVTTNMQYHVDYSYKSPVYEIGYYVSPASTFKSFKNLTVYLNTDMYIIKSNIKFAEQKNGSYKVSFDNLINKEIELALSYDKSVKNEYNRNGWSILGELLVYTLAAVTIFSFDFIFLAIAIVALIFAIKKKKINKNILHYIQTISLFVILFIISLTMFNQEFGIKVFVAILLVIPLVLGIIQLIFDTKRYKYQAIIFDSVVLAFIIIAVFLELFAPDYFSTWIIVAVTYLFNMAYLFFKSNFLKDRENKIDIQEETKNDDSISVESNDEEQNDAKDNE